MSSKKQEIILEKLRNKIYEYIDTSVLMIDFSLDITNYLDKKKINFVKTDKNNIKSFQPNSYKTIFISDVDFKNKETIKETLTNLYQILSSYGSLVVIEDFTGIDKNGKLEREKAIKDSLKYSGFNYSEIIKIDHFMIIKFFKSNLAYENFISEKQDITDFVIKAENVVKRYKNSTFNALDSVSITIKKGSIFGLLGPNGAGKTTLLSILCGLLTSDEGKVSFSEDITKDDIKNQIGYIPQDIALYNMLTARENLEFFGKIYGLEKNILKERCDELLDMIRLSDRANDLVIYYSTGMSRRLNLAIGLINKPKIILLDEPTVGIDPQSRNLIYEAILKLKEDGVTILYTTHYMEEATKLCDKVAIIDKGRILIEGNPSDLVKKYGFFRFRFASTNSIDKIFTDKIKSYPNVFDCIIKDNSVQIITKANDNNIEFVEFIKKTAQSVNLSLNLTNVLEPNLESLFLDITGRNLRDTETM